MDERITSECKHIPPEEMDAAAINLIEQARSEFHASACSAGFCRKCGAPFPPLSDDLPEDVKRCLEDVVICAECCLKTLRAYENSKQNAEAQAPMPAPENDEN